MIPTAGFAVPMQQFHTQPVQQVITQPGYQPLPLSPSQQMIGYGGGEIVMRKVDDTVINHHGQVAKLKTVGPKLDSKLTVTDYRTGETMAGVGIFFQQETDSWIYVASIVPNSSADRSGLIKPDDELVRVDSVEISPHESLEDVRTLILGPPGTYVSLFFRRAGGRGGGPGAGDFFFYDVELMRGSVEFLQRTMQMQQQQQPPPPDYSQYELEIARLRDEIEGLRQANADTAEDPRVALLQEELKARMEDLRRFEQLLQKSQDKTKEIETGRSEAVRELDLVQEDNARLVAREREHAASMDMLADTNQHNIQTLERERGQIESDLNHERTKRNEVEDQLRTQLDELNKLRAEAHARAQLEADVGSRLRQAHTTIADALQAQETQLSLLAEVVPQLDMVHASLLTALASEPVPITAEPSFPPPQSAPGSLYQEQNGRESATRNSYVPQEEYA